MGQHRTNPTALAAKRGELAPKQKQLSKRQSELLVRKEVCKKIARDTGIDLDILYLTTGVI